MSMHTSGHADYTALKQVINITTPDVVITIHSEKPIEIKQYTDKAIILEDGETFEVK